MAQRTALALINGQIAEIPATDTIRGAGGGSTISEYTTDPVAPAAGTVWVLSKPAGSPSGLLLALTQGESSYSLSFKTLAGSIVRTSLK